MTGDEVQAKVTVGAQPFDALLVKLQNERPNDRSALDRGYAVIITDLEKVMAEYIYFVGRYTPIDEKENTK